MFNLTAEEKEEMREALRVNLGGTPFQQDRDFIINLIWSLVTGWVEHREEAFKRDKEADAP